MGARLTRAAAILIEEGKVALIERQRDGQVYYLFPGGGVEFGEWPAETAAREVHEELGLIVEVQRLVAQLVFRGRTQYFFLVERTGGEFGSGLGAEMDSPADSRRGSYTPVWMPLAELDQHTIHPRQIIELIQHAVRHSWPEKVQYYSEGTR